VKIHITGMSPRMVSDRARAKISFTSLLADALRMGGHEVARDAEIHEDADLLVVGLSSMLSPASTYSVVALGLLGQALRNETPVLLFADDPELGKIRDSAASVRRDPDRLWSDWLAPKRVLASADHERDVVMEAVDLLGGEEWPTVLAPMHSWGLSSTLNKQLRIISDVVPIDVTPVLLHQLKGSGWERPRANAKMWLCEQSYTPCELTNGRTHWPILRSKNAPAWGILDVYGTVRAVHQGAITPCIGWWTPTPIFATHAGSVYLTGSEESYYIGGGFYLTVDQIEAMSDEAHDNLSDEQYLHLTEISWSLETLTSRLEDVLGQSSSWSMPGTATSAAM
jgi:hypothetical protein